MGDTVRLTGYEMGHLLGQGTQGCVYKATTRGPERKSVAIKVVLKSRLSKAGRDNLVSEIGLLKQLRHRFILELVDFHWDDRNIYIVTELCTGGDLSAVIKARRKLPESQVQRLAQQLAVALRYLREHGVSHLDLKPSNLLVSGTQPPLLKVADFGFAQHLEENATERGLRGSPLYMAPEILLKDHFDAKADIWSVGVILYEALFGKAPFSSPTLEELMVRIKEEKVVEIPSRNPPLSSDCRDLLTRCLVRSPEKRIDFSDFFDHPFLDLEHFPDQDSVQRASKIASQAVAADKSKDKERAAELYEEALKHFRLILYYQPQSEKREALRKAVAGYAKRAQELQRQKGRGGLAEEEGELDQLCASSPKLTTGLEVCRTGTLYLAQGEANLALERLTAGLGELVPVLQKEPKGRRRELLGRAVKGWMAAAEVAKEEVAMVTGEVAATPGEGEGVKSCDLM